ncbi:MAG TPA: Ig-like domain-containing protein [Burkholderiales bacterium]|nr:Ig-like domain-containing protein [Burkholderiales bacterium]
MTTLQITFVSESAGYDNVLGWYNSRTGEAGIIFINTNDDGPDAGISAGTTATIDVEQSDIDAGYIGFFVIPNGAEIYGTDEDSVLNGPLTFDTQGNGDGIIRDADGKKLRGEQGEIIFTDETLNKKNTDYARGDDNADGILGRIAFEDLVKKSDRDFNDLVIDVQVVEKNQPPVVDDQSFDIAENSALGTVVGQLAASDPDGQPLTYDILSGNESGAFAINAHGEIVVLDPSRLDFEDPALSAYALVVEVTDAGGLTDTAVVGIAVTDVNEAPPVAGDDAIATSEDEVVVRLASDLLANDTDADGSAELTIVSVENAVNGSVELLGDVVRFTPDANYSGPASFSYTVSDGDFTDTASVTLSIEAVADAPDATVADAASVGNVPIPLSISVALADADGSETLSAITISGVPEGWSLSAGVRDEETGNYTLTSAELLGLTITPAPDAVGSATLSVIAAATEASNGDSATRVATLTVSVDQEGALHGQAIDGYIVGATVFADGNENGLLDLGEASATTDAGGNFTLMGGSGPLVMSGGVDISTGHAFAGVLRAPEGATVLTPLTTLVSGLRDLGQLPGDAESNVLSALGLDTLTVGGNPIDLLHFDPVPVALAGGPDGNAAAQVFGAGIRAQNAITQVSALLAGAGATNAGAAVVAALADLVASGVPVDLADQAVAESVIVSAAAYATGDSPLDAAVVMAAAQVLAATNAAVSDALAGGSGVAVLEALAQVAWVAQGDALTADLAQAGGTNDPGTLAADYTGASLTAQIAAAPVGDVDGGLVGTLGNDTLTGGAGNDAIGGLSGNDLLIGLGGDDQLYGGPGSDTLRGGPGDDVLNGGVRADFQSFDGFTDTDRADYSAAAGPVNVNLAGGSADDGEGGTDTLIGIEAVTGSAHGDTLTGSDAFFEIFRGGAGNDTIDGAGGYDRAEYQDATGSIAVVLGAPAAHMGTVSGDSSVGTDTLIDVEQVAGTDFADTFDATGFVSADSHPGGFESNFNSFEGRGGDDEITGNGGTRIDFFTATGAVEVDLAAGVATGDASVGTDSFSGVAQVRGSAYDDTLLGGNPLSNGFEAFDGRGGDDFIDGGAGFDRADYAFNGPILSGIAVHMADGIVVGDPVFTGTDTIRGIESIRASHLDDWYDATGYSGASANAGANGTFNEFEGMAGNDTVIGNGNTRVSYIFARESVSVNLATGKGEGGASVGTDTFLGGISEVRGSNFDDLIVGSNNGTASAQIYEGRGGDDTIIGGGGFDVARYSGDAPSTGITVVMAAVNAFTGTVTGDAAIGTDTLIDVVSVRGTSFGDSYNAIGYSSTASGLGTFNEFEGGGGDDTIIGNGNTRISYLNSGAAVMVDLGAGTASGATTGSDAFTGVNSVRGSQFDDALLGGAGNDIFDGRGGSDAIDGGDGFDQARFDGGSSGAGTFIADAFGGITASAAGHGTDSLHGIELIRGTNFGDFFDGSASSVGYVFDGVGGDDTLIGSSGNDSLLGGSGNDVLVGGAGSDFLDGGTGRDRADFSGASGGVFVDLQFGAANDFLAGLGSGFDTLVNIEDVTGTDFNDTLWGNGLDNALVGGLGSDLLRGGAGNDLLDGGIIADLQSDVGFRDTDRVDYSSALWGVNVNLATGQASDDGEGGMDVLEGIESVNGSMFDDLFTGSDTTFSESFHGGGGNDHIEGGGGFDRAEYASAGPVWDPVLLTFVGVTINVGGFGGFASAAATVSGELISAGTDTMNNVEQFTGSEYADTYTVGWFLSNALPGGFLTSFNAFEGRGGDDTIFGNFNTRVDYTGATGAVTVNFDMGRAWGDASVGTDTLSNVNQVRATSFNDTLLGSFSFVNETFDGRGGDDFIDGRAGFDRADYAFNGPAAFGIFVDLDMGIVTGDPVFTGTDTLRSIESIRGTHLADTYDASGFSGFSTNAGSSGTLNEFEGMAGDDIVIGNGNTRLTFGLAREGVTVDLAAGTVEGGASVGNDLISGVNAMRGSSFDDVLMGSNHGIGFAEIYEGRAGDDTFSGRGGFDQARYDAEAATPSGVAVTMATAAGTNIGTVSGGAGIGIDTLIDIPGVVGTNFGDTYDATGYFSAITGLNTFNEFEGLGGDDTITGNGATRVSYISSFAPVTVDLNLGSATGTATGNDTLVNVFNVRGSNLGDTLLGSALNDTFEGRGGFDFIDGRDGFDLVRYDNGSFGPLSVTSDFFTNSFTATAPGHDTDTLLNIESIRGTAFDDFFDGLALLSNFTFDGRGGNDALGGSAGSDILLGGDGNDSLFGREGFDTLVGGAGQDHFLFFSPSDGLDSVDDFEGFPGGDVLVIASLLELWTSYGGGAGGPLADFVRLLLAGPDAELQIDTDGFAGAAPWQSIAVLRGGAGLDIATLLANGNLDVGAPAGGMTIIGTPGNDLLIGTPGNDTILADLGNDLLQGNAGDDVLDGGFVADYQSDTGFRDNDRADYGIATSGVMVNLVAGTAQDGQGGNDTLSGIESVTGSIHNDVIIGGDSFSENYMGSAGDDFIDGGLGNDRAEYFDASAGLVITLGSMGGLADATGSVTGDPWSGNDTLLNVERVVGTNFVDTFTVHAFLSASVSGGFLSSFNSFEGRGGDDQITGNGNTRIEFSGASGAVTVDLAAGTADGDASVGHDTFTGVNSIRASSHNDMLYGSAGNDTFDGRGGFDTIDGRGGFDRADYAFNGPAANGITVDLGLGTVTGDPAFTGNDTLISIEAIRGTHRDDAYDASGFTGFSVNAGSNGTLNEFEGMAGNDTVVGNGNTRLSFVNAREGVAVDAGAGTATGGASVGSDTFSGVNAVRGSNFGDVLDASASVAPHVLEGGRGDDTLLGSSSSDSLLGGEGNDLHRGGQGFDFLDGGAGSDTYDFDSLADGIDTIAGFAAGPGGDVLDIADLLALETSYAGGPVSEFVRLGSVGPDAELQIDPDGIAGPQLWQSLALLLGGAGLDAETLVADGNLVVGGGGGGGGVTLVGTLGNDFLEGGPGDDTLIGLLGNDFLRGGGGNDVLDGYAIADLQSDEGFRDNDRADYSFAPAGVTVSLELGTAQDGEGGTDSLIGIEAVTGSAFDDVLIGANNTFSESFRGGAGDDTIQGGGGNDLAEYFDATAPVLITVGGAGDASATVSGDASVGTDTLLEVERFSGSAFADTYNAGWFVTGSLPGGFLSSFNSFEGRGGDDQITGNGNTRVEYTSASGPVTVNLGTGATGDASVGADTYFGGINAVRGSSFDDSLTGSGNFNDESFDGRGGNDTINGGAGMDRADYAFNGPSAIGINVSLAVGSVSGDAVWTGTDKLVSVEAVRGTHLGDVYNAIGFSASGVNPGSFGTLNEFEGMAGNDTVTGNGNTRLTFVSAREGVTVDLAAGTVVGGASVGNDTVSGVNAMRGSSFDDTLMGTNNGTTSAQIYEGRAGNDTFSGRGGFDQAVYASEGAQTGITVDMDAINSFTGTVVGDAAVGTDTLIDIVSVVGTFFNDTYDATGYDSATTGLTTFNEFEGLGGNDTITGNGATRVSYISSPTGVTVNLGATGGAFGDFVGSDSYFNVFNVRGSNWDDILNGSSVNDTFEGRGGNDMINGGDGFDLVRYDNGSNGPGTFISTGSGSFTASAGGHATDTLTGIESIRGTNFGDLFDGTGSFQAYTFDGRGGDDTLIGSVQGDTLRGGDGNDLLRGGQGGDLMNGGLGMDRFDFDDPGHGIDTIEDFEAVPGVDVLDIADLLAFATTYAGGAGGDLSAFVRFENVPAGSQLQIDRDGAGPEGWQGLANLQGQTDLDLATLLANGNLDVDVL